MFLLKYCGRAVSLGLTTVSYLLLSCHFWLELVPIKLWILIFCLIPRISWVWPSNSRSVNSQQHFPGLPAHSWPWPWGEKPLQSTRLWQGLLSSYFCGHTVSLLLYWLFRLVSQMKAFDFSIHGNVVAFGFLLDIRLWFCFCKIFKIWYLDIFHLAEYDKINSK